MSSTMTLTMNALPQPRLSTIPCCPNCGIDISLTLPPKANPSNDETKTALAAAQRQIEDLQAQVRLLNQKATAAVDRWADYEDELAKLRSELTERNNSVVTAATTTATATTAATRPQTPTVKETPSSPTRGFYSGSPGAGVSGFASAASSRISALLSRKSTSNLKAGAQLPGHHHHHQSSQSISSLLPAPASANASGPNGSGHQSSYSTSSLLSPRSPLTLSLSSGKVTYTPGHSPAPSSDDLIEALGREQQLRMAAEGKLTDGSKEIEELSVTLFEQANEMVATERRARARLEERVGELERREEEKKRRLERLEKAMGRIERVRAMLGDGEGKEVSTASA
ncbi:Sporulation-specific protein 13 [Cytospora mali]|uniref:Sporulation-specific protein 13 n=1 Tax=Cytospora mali TaxID=578113 RepID=A0A194W4I9_CYTMA|nr:Sporulation-specific protein 13 [Valsa mali]